MSASPKKPTEIDAQVGVNLRVARRLCNLTQVELAALLGVSPQQMQKYERGKDRIGAGRLQAVASILGQPVAFFFGGPPDSLGSADSAQRLNGRAGNRATEAREFINAYSRVVDRKIRDQLLALVIAISAGDHSATKELPPV